MKGTTTLLLAALLLASGCSYHRVGSLTMVSTRNVDPAKPGQLLVRGVEAKAKTKHDDAMQEAIEQAVRQHPGGEYMMNTAVYVKSNGNWVKVQGDVWGTPIATTQAPVTSTNGAVIKVGDSVLWHQDMGQPKRCVVIAIRGEFATLEVPTKGKPRLKEVPLVSLSATH